jgi:fermentation-respiration switch protein FrsA (DUF1100 family)
MISDGPVRMGQLVILALLAVATLAIFVRWAEPRLAFFPIAGEEATPADFGVPFSAHTLATADGEKLRAWYLPGATTHALIVYFHGNGGNLSVWAPILVGIARRGYPVLAFDYRGYGLSTGQATERGLYRDADAVLALASTLSRRPRRVIYWGRSLGSAVAGYAASRQPPDGVIVESGFPAARSLFTSPLLALLALFSTYRFPTVAFLNQARVPALVLHGDRDSVVPYELGRALFQQLAVPKRFVAIAGGDHNDMQPADPNAYWSAVDAFIGSPTILDSQPAQP